MDRWMRDEQQWMLTEVKLASGALSVLALILFVVFRLLTMP